MAQFVQLVAAFSLCVFAAAVNAQQSTPNAGNDICTFYTKTGTLLLDGPKVFEMTLVEFGREIKTLTPQVTQQWMSEVDDDHDGRLNLAECAKFIQKVSDSIHNP